jgi:RNA polymerase sigma-70 factor, ECF subfamily
MPTGQLFDRITREHDAMIKRIAMSYEAKPHLAEDLVQEIYFAVWRALPSFRGDSSLRTFVARIATNRCVTHVVRALQLPVSTEIDEQLPAPEDGPEARAIDLDRKRKLAAAIRSLPLAYRQVAMLTLEGFVSREIADVLGITVNAVAIRLSRAKELLRGIIGDRP